MTVLLSFEKKKTDDACVCAQSGHCPQCTKKVVSDSLGLVDFAIGLVNSVFNLPDGQMMFF